MLLLLPLMAAARSPRDTIRSKQGVEIFVKNDQSRKLKLIIEAHFLDAEASAADYARVGTGINADYIFKKYFSLNVGAKGTYFSVLQADARAKSYTDNKLNPFAVASGGVRLHIVDGKGWEHRKMHLESFKELDAKGRPKTTVRFMHAKFPCRRIWALRGGYYYSMAPISANHNGDILNPLANGSVKTTDGTVFTGSYYTNTTTMGYYAGLTKITHMKMKTSSTINWLEGSSRQTALFKEVYADVLFTNTTIDPFVVKGKEYDITPNAAGSFKLSDIGWRVGGRIVSTRKRTNLGTSYEIGSRPGLASRGAYLAIGISLAFVR